MQVGVHDGRDAVRDDDAGAPDHDVAQAVQNGALGARVDAGQRVVEHQHARLAGDGAGERQALLLAAREGDAALADDGVVAVREGVEVGGDAGDLRGAPHDRVGRVVGASTPKAMLSRIEVENRNGSCGTKPMAPRSCASGSSRTSRPSSSTAPSLTSNRRGSSCTSELLPAPVRPTIASFWPGSMRERDVGRAPDGRCRAADRRRRRRGTRCGRARRAAARRRAGRRSPARWRRCARGAASRRGRAARSRASSRAPWSARRAGSGSR